MMGTEAVVATEAGVVRGLVVDGVQVFRGVPFAAPPVGELRFRSPRPVVAWEGERDATVAGPSSIQVLDPRSAWIYEDDGGPSEDCLYLNVFTPGTEGARAVLVWLHGGAFQTGHAALAAFDGTTLAREQDLVVVTCNYRLGPLGFLGHPALRDPETGHWANWGLQDQVAALRWVRANIARFGGDPGNVTVAGESAGAMAINYLAGNPANRGVFHKMIGQSPARRGGAAPPEVAGDYAEAIAAALGVEVGGLRDVPAWDLYRAAEQVGNDPQWAARFLGSGPVTDDDVILAEPYNLGADGVPLLVGSTRDESRFWHCLITPDGGLVARLPLPEGEEGLRASVERYVAGLTRNRLLIDTEALIATYRAAAPGASITDLYLDLWTDGTFRGAATGWATRHAATGAAAYSYEFAHQSPLPGVGSPHTLEIPFVFGTFGQPFMAPRAGDGPAEEALSAAMRAAWGAFARTGDPSTAEVAWPRYDATRRATGVLGGPGGPVEIVDAPREERRAAWDALYA
ncbi:MAG: carboxylesterase family protein, partial [Thermomicrobiales bacterium]